MEKRARGQSGEALLLREALAKGRAARPRSFGGDQENRSCCNQDLEAHGVAITSFKKSSRWVCEPAACAEAATLGQGRGPRLTRAEASVGTLPAPRMARLGQGDVHYPCHEAVTLLGRRQGPCPCGQAAMGARSPLNQPDESWEVGSARPRVLLPAL